MRGPWAYENPSCASVGGEFWFPEKESGLHGVTVVNFQSAEVAIAKSICNTCPHKKECGQWGLKHERFGIWGGLSERDRRPLRNRLNIIVEEVSNADIAAGVGNSSHQSDTST